MNESAMNETGGYQTPPVAVEGPRTVVSSPVQRCTRIKFQKTGAGNHHANEYRQIDGQKHRSCGIVPQRSGRHGPAGATRGCAGTAVAQNGSDSLFIHGQGSAAFQAARHGYRITKVAEIPVFCFGRCSELATSNFVRIFLWNLLCLPALSTSVRTNASLKGASCF